MQQHIYLISGLKKMKSISFLLVLLFTATSSFAQTYETNPFYQATTNWVFGDSVWLHFSDTGIVENSLPIDILGEASSSFSDSDGNLLFYIQPESLFNSTGNKITQLEGGNSSRQGSLILPLKEDSLFYIIVNSEGESNSSKDLSTYIYNSNSKSLGSKTIIHKNAVEGLTSINHQNNRSVIIASHDKNTDEFSFYILLSNKLICCPLKQNIGGQYSRGEFIVDRNGSHFKFNPVGDYFIAASSENDKAGFDRSDLFCFNNETLKLRTNIILHENVIKGVSFSSDSKHLYLNNNRLFQYDLTVYDSNQIVNSRVQLTPTWNNSLSYSQLGPNKKIYYANYDSSYLGIINAPNSSGLECNYAQKGLLLNNKTPNYGLPNFNASYFYTPSVDFAYTEDCWEHTYSFEGRDTFVALGYKWLFQKGSVSDSLLTKHCEYQFADTGKWQVSHIAWNASRADTVSKTLTIRPKWKNNLLGKDTFYCLPFDSGQGDSSARADFTLTLKAPADMHCVHWNGEEPNLDDALGLIVDYGHFHTDTLQVDTAGKYIVKLTNKTFCQMYDTITVSEVPNPQKPSIQRNGQELESSITAAEYRWYYNGNLTLTTINSQLIPDSNGYWQVQLISEYGCESQLSDSFNVGFASLKPLNPKPLSFKIYPNPSDGHISIEVPKEGQYNLTLSTIGGQLVRLSDSPQGELYRSVNKRIEFKLNLANGTYILTLTDEDGKAGSKKIEVVN
jgi:hypothetical protein